MTGEESTTIPTMSSYEELSHILRSNIFPSVGSEWRTSTGSTYTGHDITSSEVARDTTHFRHKDWLGGCKNNRLYSTLLYFLKFENLTLLIAVCP